MTTLTMQAAERVDHKDLVDSMVRPVGRARGLNTTLEALGLATFSNSTLAVLGWTRLRKFVQGDAVDSIGQALPQDALFEALMWRPNY